MKKIIVLLALCLLPLLSNAQTVDDVPLKDIKTPYIEIVGMAKFLSMTKISIMIDYGQEKKIFQDTRVMDENGKPVVFSSMVDGLNFFTKYGYEFVTAYAVTTGNSNVYHYLLKNKSYKEQ